MRISKNKSLVTINENIFTNFLRFIKTKFAKEEVRYLKECDINDENINISYDVYRIKRTKTEIFSIYNSAKNNAYDLNDLNIEEIKILNSLLEDEIKMKTDKLNKIMEKTM